MCIHTHIHINVHIHTSTYTYLFYYRLSVLGDVSTIHFLSQCKVEYHIIVTLKFRH